MLEILLYVFMDLYLVKVSWCRLDLYLPKNMNGPKPVVAFVTGGAWIIGCVIKSFHSITYIYPYNRGISYVVKSSLR